MDSTVSDVIDAREIKVSVCVITFNQEKYISQCLQSIVDQQTSFRFEVIVGEDCSRDKTKHIVSDFVARYPRIIKPIYQARNIGGGNHNLMTTHDAAVGEYIAHVDGDDFCLPGKLQAMSDLLDSDPDCNVVFHRMLVLADADTIEFQGPHLKTPNLKVRRFYRADFLQHPTIGWQSAKMYRASRRLYSQPSFELTDVYATIEQVGDGYARFTGYQELGCYRLFIGITKNRSRLAVALTEMYLHYCREYPQFRKQINTSLLVYLIADLKNCRSTSVIYLKAWIKTFHPLSFYRLISSLSVVKRLMIRPQN
jgi:glycosyltransferase involved in cell wall biosynthesis